MGRLVSLTASVIEYIISSALSIKLAASTDLSIWKAVSHTERASLAKLLCPHMSSFHV